MTRRSRWSLVCLIVATGAATTAVSSTPARSDPDGIETVRVPSESMEPTIPIGATIEVDYDAFDAGPPNLGDIVVFHPPRSADHMRDDGTYRCGTRRRPRQMCPKPVPRRSDAKYLKRVVGLPGDRLRLRDGRLTRNGQRLDEPFADRSHCDHSSSDCDFPRRITVPRRHYFLLGDNRGRSHDSRHWGPVPRRAFLARVGGCTTSSGEHCGDEPPPPDTATGP